MKGRLTWVVVFIFLGLTIQVVRFWPDGKLHIFFCDVGQGDAAYIRFPDGQDMLIDGGPDNRVLKCLSEAMPFYDRVIDVVLLTHPQSDHLNGLISVVDRYSLNYFIMPEITNDTVGYKKLIRQLADKNIAVRHLYAGAKIRFGNSSLTVLWPEQQADILGSSSHPDPNLFSMVTRLSYANFDALFTGDSNSSIEAQIAKDGQLSLPPDGIVEVLKVPHHGSKTGMLESFIANLAPKLAVVSVGSKNRYGHPTQEALELLGRVGARVLRTDLDGTIEVISDGKTWEVKP